MPPRRSPEDAYPWHLANRNKRGIALDLKSPSAQQVLEKLVKWLTYSSQYATSRARAMKLEYQDVVRWNRGSSTRTSQASATGRIANLPGFDITSYWARSGLLSMTRDAGRPDLAGGRQW